MAPRKKSEEPTLKVLTPVTDNLLLNSFQISSISKLGMTYVFTMTNGEKYETGEDSITQEAFSIYRLERLS